MQHKEDRSFTAVPSAPLAACWCSSPRSNLGQSSGQRKQLEEDDGEARTAADEVFRRARDHETGEHEERRAARRAGHLPLTHGSPAAAAPSLLPSRQWTGRQSQSWASQWTWQLHPTLVLLLCGFHPTLVLLLRCFHPTCLSYLRCFHPAFSALVAPLSLVVAYHFFSCCAALLQLLLLCCFQHTLLSFLLRCFRQTPLFSVALVSSN